MSTPHPNPQEQDRTGLVIVASTRAAQGIYTDTSGPALVSWLNQQGIITPAATVIADRDFPSYFQKLLAQGRLPRVILTSGGTGLTPDDLTVDTVQPHLTRELPGIMQAFWARGLETTPTAILSRGIAGTIGSSFIMTLPGSTGAIKDACATLAPIIHHICSQLEDHHDH